jgi:hypothetical protein
MERVPFPLTVQNTATVWMRKTTWRSVEPWGGKWGWPFPRGFSSPERKKGGDINSSDDQGSLLFFGNQ